MDTQQPEFKSTFQQEPPATPKNTWLEANGFQEQCSGKNWTAYQLTADNAPRHQKQNTLLTVLVIEDRITPTGWYFKIDTGNHIDNWYTGFPDDLFPDIISEFNEIRRGKIGVDQFFPEYECDPAEPLKWAPEYVRGQLGIEVKQSEPIITV